MLKTVTPNQIEFRAAMRQFPAAVNILTTNGPAGRRGVTVSAACSVSDQPPTILVCLNALNDHNDVVLENGVFCLNTLAVGHEPVSRVFAGQDDLEQDDRFAAATWDRLETGAPVLSCAVAAFDCRIEQVQRVATHHVIFGTVAAIRYRDDAEPLLYHNREYRSLKR